MFHKLHEYTAEGRRSKGCSKWLEYFSVVLCTGKEGGGSPHSLTPPCRSHCCNLFIPAGHDKHTAELEMKRDRIGLQLGWQILNG